MDDKLRKAMMAGYYAIINNKKLEGSLYRNFENGDEISFLEAAKYLVCTAKGLNPEECEIQIYKPGTTTKK